MKKEEIIRLNTKNIINTTIKNEKLKAVLLGNNFLYGGIESQTPFYVHALTSGSYIQSAYKCIKGGSQITKQLVKQLRKYKVKILKHHIISHLHCSEKGEILYAENQNGEKIYAKNFISNIDIKHTLHLIGENYFPTSFTKRVKSLSPISSCFSLYLVKT